jgi:hypothetical protein
MSARAVVFDEAEIGRIAMLEGDELAARHVDVLRRMRGSLPRRCVDEFARFTQGEVFAIVCGEAAMAALGRSPRSLIDQRDELDRTHTSLSRRAEDYKRLADGADQKNPIVRALGRRWLDESGLSRLAAKMTFAQWRGVASVLDTQMSRESWERGGLHVPEEWRLPIRPDDGSPPDLELVAIDPTPPPIGPAGAGGAVGDLGADGEADKPNGEPIRLDDASPLALSPLALELVAIDPTPPNGPAGACGAAGDLGAGASGEAGKPSGEDGDDSVTGTDGLGFLDR